MTLRDVDYQTVGEALRAYSGTSVTRLRAEVLEARLEQLARTLGMQVAPLIDHLRPPLNGSSSELVDGLVNCETSFFRDAPAFAALRDFVIPGAVERRAKARQLRVLCAGCSTGQEAYSVAMLIREHFRELAQWNVEVLGVDISAKRIERAAVGIYSKREIERGVPPLLVDKYFREDDGELRISTALRAVTHFRRVNLNEPWQSLVGFDIVLLRNVLIYLDDTAKAAMLTEAQRSMHKTGMLVLGAAETVSSARNAFDRMTYAAYPIYTPRQG